MIALLALAFNLRTAITAVPPLLDRIDADLQFTPALIGVLGALPTVAFAVAGLIGAGLLRRLTAERIAVGVVALTGLGQLVRPWAGGAPGFLALSALTLLAMGVGNVILSALVRAWFPNRIGAATSAYMTCVTIGTALPALFAVPLAGLVPGVGWQLGLVAWSATALVVVPAWLVIARRPRALPAAVESATSRLPLYRSPIAWGVALLFGMSSLNIYSMITWLPVRLMDAGFSPERAGTELAIYAGVGVLPSLLLPLIAVRIRRPQLLVPGCALAFAIGYAGLLFAPTQLTTLWGLIGGLGGGAFPLATTLVVMRSATPASAGALSAFGQGIGYTLAGVGPLVVGLLHEATSGWAAPFIFLGSTLLLMLVAGRLLAPVRTVEADLALRSTDTLER